MAGYYNSTDAYRYSCDALSKPMLGVYTSHLPLENGTESEPYKQVPRYPNYDNNMVPLETNDKRLKYRIRVLRLISRILALGISTATLVPLIMTLVKFLRTKDVYFLVNGKERTAWPQDPITWYTWMYFGVSLISFVFNLGTIIAYCKGTDKANSISSIASWWTTAVLVGHVIVWAVGTVLYRYGKEPVKGKFRDLWGWTCSPAAFAIQSSVTNIDFRQYCTIQSVSFYTGIVNVATGILSAFIFLLAVIRFRSKKRLQRLQSHH
ncbi:hypothetical protein Q7P37_000551 [Cladosporium fusiforme]